MFLPVSITDDYYRRAASRYFFVRQKRATLGQRNAEHGKIIRANNGAERATCIALLSDPDERHMIRHGVGEAAVLNADVFISRIRNAPVSFRSLFVLRKYL